MWGTDKMLNGGFTVTNNKKKDQTEASVVFEKHADKTCNDTKIYFKCRGHIYIL